MWALSSFGRGPLTLLAIGAHPDDLELGCGGTVLRLIADGRVSEVVWVVLTGTVERAREAHQGASAFLAGAKHKQVVIREYRDAFLPYQGAAVKEFFEELKDRVAPDLILTHRRDDLHQDHRLCGELTWNSFRDHLILEYEIPKYDGDLGSPNVFVALDEEVVRRKVDLILSSFPSQSTRRWFSESTFRAILRLRGVEAGGDAEFAEGFTVRKLTLEP